MKNQTIVAIDVGSGSIKGVLANLSENDVIEIIAHAERPCLIGVRAGEVFKPEEAAKAIQRVKSELGQKGNIKIKSAIVNINGPHIYSVPSQGLVSVSRADQKISKEDIERVFRAAETINLPSNKKEILQCFPKEFIVDGEGGIKEPLGLEGIRLEVKTILLSVFSPVLKNLQQAFDLAGLEISDIVLGPLAQSEAILSEEQKELGVALVDIGFATTAVIAFEKGDLLDFSIFPAGSSHATNDLALALRTEIQTAEGLKRDYGSLFPLTPKQSKEKIKILEKEIDCSKKFLFNIITCRMNEIFNEVEKRLKRIISQTSLPSGVVLCGGGAFLPGIAEFAKDKFKLPCKTGKPRNVKGASDNRFSLCYGLAHCGFNDKFSKSGFSAEPVFLKGIKKVFKVFLP